MTAVVGGGPSAVAASISMLAALVALGLTSPRLDRPHPTHPQRVWAYLPPLLATASLIGVPLTLGWEGRGALYQATWEAGALGVLALVVVAEGAALSVLYRYWQRLLGGRPAEAKHQTPDKPPQEAESLPEKSGKGENEAGIWRLLGATLACIPFLIPVIGPRLVLGTSFPPVYDPAMLSISLGLVGSLLWALFLGYGRRRLLSSLPFPRRRLASLMRLGWLLQSLGQVLDTLARAMLRIRAVIEGEHYLAWAILLALGLGLVILLR